MEIINEEFLQQIELLRVLIRKNVAGMFGGNHKAKTFGSSCEFTDFRDYEEGDDISKIDWNAYARSENLYLKLYLDERRMHTRIYIDASRSMGFGKSKKDVQAIRLAAAFAYLSVCDTDKVSVYAIHGSELETLISGIQGREQFTDHIGVLNNIEFYGECSISDAILPSKVGYGDGLSVIISDFLTDNDYDGAVNLLSDKKRDVLCLQVLSPEELNPKVRGKMHYFDSEDSTKYYRKNISRDIINAYRLALEYVQDRIRNLCRVRGQNYALVSTDDNVAQLFYNRLAEEEVLK